MTRIRTLQSTVDSVDSSNSFEFGFPIFVAVIFCMSSVFLALQYAYWWVCRTYFGRVDSVEGDEILASLTEEQRRAVFQAVVSKLCKVRNC